MTAAEAVGIFLAGTAAGTINTVVGSGTLITFPALLAAGFPPVTANVSNTIGLVPGSISGAIGYRRELVGQRARVLRLGTCSFLGGVTGAILLLELPEDLFKAIVPFFIVVALLGIIFQPQIRSRLGKRREDMREHGGAGTLAGVYVGGVYGGYFGAAQGILLLSIMGLTIPDDLQRLNALKNVLAGLVNAVSGAIFIVVADPAWDAVALIAVGSTIGGQLGAAFGRRLPASVLRGIIVVVGIIAIVQLV